MESLNEILPKYKLIKNGVEVSVSVNRLNIMSDYNSTVQDANEYDRVEVLEGHKVIVSTIVASDSQ